MSRCVSNTLEGRKCRNYAKWGNYCSVHLRDFVILVGQPGSGKSTAVYKFLQEELKLKCSPASCTSVQFVSVDSLVENDLSYRERIQQKKNEVQINIDEGTDSKYTETIANDFNNIYLDVRDKRGYSRANEESLQRNVLARQNIVFEITGLNSATWEKLCKDQLDVGNLFIRQKGYRVTVVFAYTTHSALKPRILGRFKGGGRLTPLNRLQENERALVDNITLLLKTHVGCVDRLVIYDNNEDNAPKIILDTSSISDVSSVRVPETPEALRSIFVAMELSPSLLRTRFSRVVSGVTQQTKGVR